MKTASAILLNSLLLAVSLAMLPLLSVAQSPYSDTYINKSSLQREAEEAKKQRELNEQRRIEYEKQYREQQLAKKSETQSSQQETIKKPEDFASYAEYREYLDALGQRTKQNTHNTTSTEGVQQQNASVVNNYYVNTQPQSTQQIVRTSVVYDPFWDSSVTMGLFFDPWYVTTYRVRYYHPNYYWRDPYWDYPWGYSYVGWSSPWGWSNYDRGFHDGYRAGAYDYGYPSYYGGYYAPPALSIPREPIVYGARRSSTSSMSGYGQVQRSAAAQTVRAQSNADAYYRTNNVQTTRSSDYMPTYTRPESGSSRHYNTSNEASQYRTKTPEYNGQTTRQYDRGYQNSQSTRGSYDNNQNNSSTRSYSPPSTRSSSSYNNSTPQTTRGGNTGSNNNSNGSSIQQTTRR